MKQTHNSKVGHVAALAMKRTGSEIDVANFGCLDGSPVPAIGFDEAPRTP